MQQKDPYTLVLGASPNEERYSHLAILRLRAAGLPVIAIGAREGTVADVTIRTDWTEIANESIDTLTLYLGAARQTEHYESIIAVHPRRIIFNPGAENPELEQLAAANGIATLQACTLVMLQTGQY